MTDHAAPAWVMPKFWIAVARARRLGLVDTITAAAVYRRDKAGIDRASGRVYLYPHLASNPGPIVDALAVAKFEGRIVAIRMLGSRWTSVHAVHAARYGIAPEEAVRAAAIRALARDLIIDHLRHRSIGRTA